jgi:2-hydroxy-6-oxonona-2,4-dienedioate hydrolase
MSSRRVIRGIGALVGAGAFGLAYSRYRRDIRRARERISTGSRIAETPSGPVEYAVAGDGPPVLVVHGAGGGFDQALYLAAPLVDAGFRVVAPSRFGYLRTPLPADASAEAQADAHARLLDALGIARAAVLGASAGAPSAMQFALRHPERIAALILLVPAAYPAHVAARSAGAAPEGPPRATAILFDTALKSDFLFWLAMRLARRTVHRAILATPPSVVAHASPGERARVEGVLERVLPIRARRLGLLNDARVTSSLPRYELERIAAPTLAISLEDDLFRTYEGARYSADHVPNARFVGYPTGGHLWVGHHEELMGEVARFLAAAVPAS